MAKNKLVPVKFLRRYGVYNAGETAGFEADTSRQLCAGEKPFAKSLADIEREAAEIDEDEEEGEGEGSSWQDNS